MYRNEYAPGVAQPDPEELRGWRVPLLEPDQLLQAFSGRLRSDLTVVGWMRDLADLHAELIPRRNDPALRRRNCDCEEVRSEIDRVVNDIDVWAVRNVPRMKSARMHTHSLGEVLSHIAMAFANAWWTALHATDVELRYRAWLHLAQVRDGYAEMVSEMRARRLQLPLGGSQMRACTV